jgi:alpha-amylase/alpha-mannosidase (GH57 family)
MNRVDLVLLWHMHQPDYRDASNGAFLLPWTRLHALKDYWGMVKLLEEFPDIHATFNLVPSLVRQIEQYAGGQFHEPWFELAFRPAEGLSEEQRQTILRRSFHAHRDRMIRRWPRFSELFQKINQWSAAVAVERLNWRDWRDLQVFSQLVWTDEEYIARHPGIHALAEKGSDFTEADKGVLREAQAELLARVLPEYRAAAERGQIELSTSPFYHPILPLLIHSDVAREANPRTRLLQPPFRHPEDAREQLVRARALFQQVFGQTPAGLWPSEGSVSHEAARMAAAEGFGWLASDEGVLSRTLHVGFSRDARGVPQNAALLYSPHRFRDGGSEIVALFRDHYLSDLIGFVYARMEPEAAAEDLHRRLRTIGESVSTGRPVTVSLILDGENAWESYLENGRPFLREFYRRIQDDPDIQAMTASEAIAAAGEIPTLERLAAGSWINANFDIWYGDETDLRAWELLREAHDAFDAESARGQTPPAERERAYESLLVAEGSDWCWWYGPEHASAEEVDFDRLYRTRLAGVYAALSCPAPDSLAQPIKAPPRWSFLIPPSGFLSPVLDGRVSNYFEWLGAGLYITDRRGAAMHGATAYIGEMHFGFDAKHLFLRLDPMPGKLPSLADCEFRVFLEGAKEFRVCLRIEGGRLTRCTGERNDEPASAETVEAAFGRILEVSVRRDAIPMAGPRLGLSVALWHGGLPVEILPPEGKLEILLGEENFAWTSPEL